MYTKRLLFTDLKISKINLITEIYTNIYQYSTSCIIAWWLRIFKQINIHYVIFTLQQPTEQEGIIINEKPSQNKIQMSQWQLKSQD